MKLGRRLQHILVVVIAVVEWPELQCIFLVVVVRLQHILVVVMAAVEWPELQCIFLVVVVVVAVEVFLC